MNKDTKYIKRCFDLAQLGRQLVQPNPMVGSVLVHDDIIIGEGYHERFGGPHAEVNCINNVSKENSSLIKVSTLYVGLEPCAHYGKTPPCVKLILENNIKKVVYSCDDNYELVNGNGFKILTENGVSIEKHILLEEGLYINRRFFLYNSYHRPFIILKWAQTKQGFFAPSDGSRLQISNVHSRQLVHRWRTEESAILVGYKTALNDNPQLNSRFWNGNSPLRIVFDRLNQLPKDLHLFTDNQPTWILNENIELTNGNVHFKKVIFDESILKQINDLLFENKIQSLIVEGGAQLIQSYIDQQMWDEARIFTTGKNISNGIKAPELSNFSTYKQFEIDNDLLQIHHSIHD